MKMSGSNTEKSREVILPPYGRMTELHMNAIGDPAKFFPKDWRAPIGIPAEDHHHKFLENVVTVLQDLLWPEYTGSGWKGKARATMLQLTELDLRLLSEIQRDKLIDGPIFADVTRIHRSLFVCEDSGGEPFGGIYGEYDPNASAPLLKKMSDEGNVGLQKKVGSGPLTVKLRLQRPRPYQAEILLAEQTLFDLEALSANTPSMMSGHCLQGLLCLGSIFEVLLNDGETITDKMLQYAADIGDRRVMAGVHYPSDNLASWLMVLLSAPFVFRNENVRPLLWRAITEFSEVYRRVVKSADPLYLPALQAIQDAYEV